MGEEGKKKSKNGHAVVRLMYFDASAVITVILLIDDMRVKL